MIVNRLQSMRRARRRLAGVTFCARTFQKPAHYFCYCPTGPSGRAGRGLPTGGVGACRARRRGLLWLCFGVSCGICAGAIVLTSCLAIAPGHRIRRVCRAWPSCRGRGYGVPGRGRRAWVRRPWPPSPCLCCLWTCRRRVVATRRRMLVFAMVLAWSVLTQFALHT